MTVLKRPVIASMQKGFQQQLHDACVSSPALTRSPPQAKSLISVSLEFSSTSSAHDGEHNTSKSRFALERARCGVDKFCTGADISEYLPSSDCV